MTASLIGEPHMRKLEDGVGASLDILPTGELLQELNTPLAIHSVVTKHFASARMNLASCDPVEIDLMLTPSSPAVRLRSSVNRFHFSMTLMEMAQKREAHGGAGGPSPLALNSAHFSVSNPLLDWQSFQRYMYQSEGRACEDVIIDYLGIPVEDPAPDLLKALWFAPSQIEGRATGDDLGYFRSVILRIMTDDSKMERLRTRYPRIVLNCYTPSIPPHVLESAESKATYLADVVIIGAGPIGLWVAILMKIQRASLNIFMLEKRSAYERFHEVDLEEAAFSHMPDHPRLKAVVASFKEHYSESTDIVCAIRGEKGIRVPIRVIEGAFKQLAIELGIYISTSDEVRDPFSLHRRFTRAKLFIGADGAHSVVRRQIFNGGRERDELAINNKVMDSIQVKYTLQSCGKAVFYGSPPWSKGVWRTLEKMEHLLFNEGISKKDGRSVTLVFKSKPSTAEAIREARFKEPFSLNDRRIPETLRQDIQTWLGMKTSLYSEERVRGSVKITLVPLAAYLSKEIVCRREDRIWALVGDAAAGFPFRKGFNVGIAAGIPFAHAVASASSGAFALDEYKTVLNKKAYEVNKYVKSRATQIEELNIATGITGLLTGIFRIPGIAWSEEQLREFRTLGGDF